MLGFPLGILSAAGAGGVPFESDYELISTTVLGGTAASVTFSNLGDYSSTYKHLQIRYTARTTRTEADEIIQVNINAGGVGTNQRNHELRGDGSVVESDDRTSLFRFGYCAGANSVASSFGGGIIDVLDPYSTTKNKTFKNLSGMTSSNYITLSSLLWNSTSSITSIGIQGGFGNLVAGSRFSLYGMKG